MSEDVVNEEALGTKRVEMSQRPAEEAERLSSLVPPPEKVNQLIEKNVEGPAKQAELMTRAAILGPLLRDPNRLGMTEDHIATVKDYARQAGEKAGQEIDAKLEKNPQEQIDQALFKVHEELPDFRNEDRMYIGLASSNMHHNQNLLREEIAKYQQIQDIEGNPVSFEEAFDATFLDNNGWPKFDTNIHLIATADAMEGVMREIGALKRDQELATLKSTSRWNTDSRTLGNFRGALIDGESGEFVRLPTDIPGLAVTIAEEDRSITNLGNMYKMTGIVDREVVKEIVAVPPVPSVFNRPTAPPTGE